MFSTFLEKVGGIFDSRFVVTYWMPVFMGTGLLGSLITGLLGFTIVLQWWKELDTSAQFISGAGSLFMITMLAYFLAAWSMSLLRFYEGYWSSSPLIRPLTAWACSYQIRRAKKRGQTVSSGQIPSDQQFAKPTRLGNVIAAAEEHSYQMYRLNAVILWPRLAALLSDAFLMQMDNALTSMMTLLNLSLIFTLLAPLGCIIAFIFHQSLWLYLTIVLAGLLLARMQYVAAVNQALNYGMFIRVAFDLYRHELLKQMRITAPDNLVHERLLWDALNGWLVAYRPPHEAKSALLKKLPQLASPFYYDTHQEATSSEESFDVLRDALLQLEAQRQSKLGETYPSDINLSRANLRGANLSGADLSRADLTEAKLQDIVVINNEKLEKRVNSLHNAITPDKSAKKSQTILEPDVPKQEQLANLPKERLAPLGATRRLYPNRSANTSALSPKLQQVLDAYRNGYTTSRLIAPVLGCKRTKAAELLLQLKARKLIDA